MDGNLRKSYAFKENHAFIRHRKEGFLSPFHKEQEDTMWEIEPKFDLCLQEKTL